MSGAIAVGLGVIIGSAGATKLLRRGDRVDSETSGLRSTSTMPWRVIGGFELILGLALAALRSRIPLLLAVGFLVAATAYLAVRLAWLDRGPCACWGPRRDDRTERFGDEGVREALRPAWYFARNGGLVAAAAIALGWSTAPTATAVGTVWLLVTIGTLISVARLRALSKREDVARSPEAPSRR